MTFQLSLFAVAAVGAVYTGLRWCNAEKNVDHRSVQGAIFFGLYVDEEGRCIICRQNNQISKHRLVANKKTLEVGLGLWEDVVSTDEIFNLWQYLDDEKFLLTALCALKPLFVSHLVPKHCTFVHPYSLSPEKIRVFASGVIKAGLANQAYPFTLHSAVIHGLYIPLSWWDISTIAIVLPDGKCITATPGDGIINSESTRMVFPKETVLGELTSDMRQVEEIILLDNDLPPTDYTPYLVQESLDIIARGASLWGRRRAGTSPIWFNRAPKINILVADSTSRVQSVVHPVLEQGVSKTGQAIVMTVVDGQTTIEVRVLCDESPLTSLVLRGLPSQPAGQVEVVFCVSVIPANEISDKCRAILQLVERKSGLRISQRIKLVTSDVVWPNEPVNVALSKTQSTERPVCSDYDLLMATQYPET
ncbi:hypothetical protein CPB83DRAFT_855943 [Crepidotus variabilis]|uniref:Uncharacterized protein n=1 Tax=Crepidotus variabilis TaxID=179855 RepID=A0A9P6JPC5_9AGAR|nr:hypothetical protein CPB83DRAFT_855943 [Crepidotus variabilis]